jgi:zinc transport system ATP-binding protein
LENESVPNDPVISFRDVTFSYGGMPALEDVSLAVHDRQAVCIVGPNGGGKTTLVKLILGLLRPQQGEIHVFGQPPCRARLRAGYMPQHVQHDAQFPVTVMDIVLMGRLGQAHVAQPPSAVHAGSHSRGRLCHTLCGLTGWRGKADRRAALDAMKQVGLEDFGRRPFASLSGGQRQRVLIARALCCNPDLLLLDEPTSNVDSLVEARLFDLLKELNQRMTIIMVSHDLGFVSGFVESVICVNRRVVVHPTAEITGEVIRDVYGGEVRMVRHDEFSPCEHSHDFSPFGHAHD